MLIEDDALLCEIEDRKVSMRIPNTRIVFSFFSRVVRTWIIEFSTGTSLRHVVEDHHRSSWGLNSAWKIQYFQPTCTREKSDISKLDVSIK